MRRRDQSETLRVSESPGRFRLLRRRAINGERPEYRATGTLTVVGTAIYRASRSQYDGAQGRRRSRFFRAGRQTSSWPRARRHHPRRRAMLPMRIKPITERAECAGICVVQPVLWDGMALATAPANRRPMMAPGPRSWWHRFQRDRGDRARFATVLADQLRDIPHLLHVFAARDAVCCERTDGHVPLPPTLRSALSKTCVRAWNPRLDADEEERFGATWAIVSGLTAKEIVEFADENAMRPHRDGHARPHAGSRTCCSAASPSRSSGRRRVRC